MYPEGMMQAGVGRVAVALAVLVALSLSGCATYIGPPLASHSAEASSSPRPTPTSTPGADLGSGIPLGYSCDELVDPSVITQLDVRMKVDTAYVPAAATSAERAVAIGGTACRWVDSTTGASLIVSAAHPDAPTLVSLRAATAAYATPTTAFGTFGLQGYAANIQMEVYTASNFWLTAVSPLFTDMNKAKLVVDEAIESLPN
jgi:hypothetical protein